MTGPSRPFRTAFVGGGGRGLGRAIAQALARDGYEVWVSSRTRSELEAVRAEIERAGGRCHIQDADLSSPDDTAAAIASAHQRMGSIGVLVCCAGAHPHNYPVEEYPVEYWRFMLEINLGSVFYAVRAAVPIMKAQGHGRIINISSVAGKVGPPSASAYVAAKHGVLGLTRGLASELGRFGITVNALCPGFVDTQMTAHKTALRAWAIERAPVGRVVEADEVAALVVHLAGPGAGAITGQAISVCGGLTM